MIERANVPPREANLRSQVLRQQKDIEKLQGYAKALRKGQHEKLVIAAMQSFISRVPFEKDFTDAMMISIVDMSFDMADLMVTVSYQENQ